MKYIPTIGLEIHSQLATKTKIFCGCSTEFGGEPNSHSCPVCLGMPGVLPVLNRTVVELAIRLGMRTGGSIQPQSFFARKNYFYPDLPKGYQISMFEQPLIRGGHFDIQTPAGTKTIRLNRIHLEEDAGKLIHGEGASESLFDVNRCGVPLIEIVTEPDFETLEEVTLFLNGLKEVIVFSGVSNGRMAEGNLRVDANISMRPEGQKELGTRTEIKNMNSFVNVVSAVSYEIDRQTAVLSQGGVIVQETLLYDALKDTVSSMRSKEEAHDYRYFPEPDLVPIVVDEKWVQKVRSELPELRHEMRIRFERQYGIPSYDAEILTTSPDIAGFYEKVVTAGAQAKPASNWMMGEVLRILNDRQIGIEEFKVTPGMLASLLKMVDSGAISGSMAKTVFDEMAASGGDPETIVDQKGLKQISDRDSLRTICLEIISSNPGEVSRYKAGKKQLMGFFVGEVMKKTRGKANPQEVNAIFLEILS